MCYRYVSKKVPLLRLKRDDLIIDRDLLKQTLQSGSVTALQQTCQPIGKVVIQGMIISQGISAIAAFNAVSKVDDFAFIPAQSISNAMMTCIAQNRGNQNENRVKETLKKGLRLEFFYWLLIGSITFLLKRPILSLFTTNGGEMIDLGMNYLTLMSFFYLLPAFTNGMQGYFRGIGQMKTTLYGTLIQISVRVIIIYLLVPIIGLNGAAIGYFVGWTFMLLYQWFSYSKLAT